MSRLFLPSSLPPLPVDATLPDLYAGLAATPRAVLCAPPGAGKTTRVPLALLLDGPWLNGRRILMLEPRRLAAKSAARFMAHMLGEDVGRRVGYRTRLESRISGDTRIEVLTEGILTRMLQDDPELPGVGCVIFDEFHERSLHADTGLALCLDAQEALRPDLRIVVMSATLDSEAVGRLMGHCPVYHSQGRTFPVDIRHAPLPAHTGLEEHVAAVVRHALQQEAGSILVFLPGTAEIRRVEERLFPLPDGVRIYPLYGDLPPAEQDAAICPCRPPERKVVLATAIAETSLTIDGVRVVVDAGLARRSVFVPARGMGQLITEKVSLAGANQRSGRAGRTEPGTAWRLWAREEEHALRKYMRPEILDADLAPLMLQLAAWGTTEPSQLRWLDSPPDAAVLLARQTLYTLGAMDAAGRITVHGRALHSLPLHPRLAHMVLAACDEDYPLACCLASLMGERLTSRRAGSDIHAPLRQLCTGNGAQAQGLRQMARRIARLSTTRAHAASLPDAPFFRQALQAAEKQGTGRLLATAWPEWLAQRVEAGNFRLRCGRAATLPLDDALAHAPFLAVAALDGGSTRARIHAAAPIAEETVEALFGTQMEIRDSVVWDSQSDAVLARRTRTLGALVLHAAPLSEPAPEACTEAVLRGIVALGLHVLPWTDELRQWQARVACMRQLEGEIWPEADDVALLRTLPQWLGPWLVGTTRRSQFRALPLRDALQSLLPWELAARLNAAAPTHITVPSGSRLRIDYTQTGGPALAVKLQEMFGCSDTPCIAEGRVPLTLHLNSPAGRPLQVTRDLRSFWQNGYASVRAEMRGRYPRHPWPENPATAEPTRRAKARNAHSGV